MTKKKLLIVVGAVLGVFLIGFMFYTMNKGNNHPQFQLEDGKTGTLKSEAKTSSEKKLPSDPEEAAKATLEQSDKEIKSYKDEIKEKLKVMISNVGSGDLKAQPPYQITERGILTSLSNALVGGYTFDENSLSVYNSDSKNVKQFTFNMVSEGTYVSFTGNYVTGTGQIQLATMQGSLNIAK